MFRKRFWCPAFFLGVLFWTGAVQAGEQDVFDHIDSITCDYGSYHDGLDLCPFIHLPLTCKRRIVNFFKWNEDTEYVQPEIQREMAWLWVQQENYLDGQYNLSNELCKRWIQYRVSVKYAWVMFHAYATELRR